MSTRQETKDLWPAPPEAARRRVIRKKGRSYTPFLIGGAVVLAGVLLYFLLPTDARDKALQSVVQGLLLGGVYALLALGVVVVYKSSKLFNITFGGLSMFVAFFAWWLISRAGLPTWPSLLLVTVVMALVGIAINRIFIIKMIGDPGMGAFIVTMVLGLSVIYGLGVLIFKGSPQVMPGFLPSGNGSFGGASFSYTWLIASAIAVALFLVFIIFFRFTKMGLSMRVVSENAVVAQGMGIKVKRIFDISWAIGGVSAAISGILLGSMFSVNTDISGFALSRCFPVLFLGGMDSLPGALVAALIIGVVEMLSGAYVEPHISGFSEIIPWILIMAILMLRPSGLFGSREIRRL